MRFLLVALFIGIPLLEIAAINQVQAFLGWPLTIAILVLDSVLGAYLVRLQGALAWRRLTEAIGQARLPAEEVVDGALILFGGALLLTPGFVTDFAGLAMVFPPTRKLLNGVIRRRVEVSPGPFGTFMNLGGLAGGGRGRAAGGRRRPGAAPAAIDVEVLEVRRTSPGEPGARTDTGRPT